MIYVFGSSGFIGKHLVKHLKSLEFKVTEIHHDELYDIKKADYIFYLSSYGNHITQTDKHETIKANILDLYDLLKATKKVNYKGFIHFSTSSVILPVQTLYSESKFVAEIICKRYAKKHHKPVVSIRPYSVFGTGEADFRFIPTVIRSLKTHTIINLSQGVHDWIYIDDFIDGIIKVMDSVDKVVGKCISIGTGKQYSNFDIVQKLIEISGKPLETKTDNSIKRPYDTNTWVADPTIIKSLGWRQMHTIEQGLRKVWSE